MSLRDVILLFVVPIAGGLGVALVGAIIGAWLWETWLRDYRKNRAFRRVLNFAPGRKVVFIFPTRDPPTGRLFRDVAWEDMRALDYLARACSRGGHEWVTRRPTERFTNADKQDNLVLICSPITNSVTRAALQAIRKEYPNFDVDVFPELSPACSFGLVQGVIKFVSRRNGYVQRKRMRYFDAEYSSPSFDQTDPAGKLIDWGVVAKVNSPASWNPRTKILFVFGIRAIGTWGAAKFLFENINQIYQRYGDKEFAFMVKVTEEEFRITEKPWQNQKEHKDFVSVD
jgi:hypothetical protein